MTETTADKTTLDALFEAGAHYGYKKSRRHPSTAEYIFGVKNTIEIFDLEKTHAQLEAAKTFVQDAAAKGQVLFVSGKPESKTMLRNAAMEVEAPYVAGRWIGGTLTNFTEIKKRVDRLVKLRTQQERGELNQYTKHERLMISREVTKLEEMFGGLVGMETLPKALFVIDPRQEHAAVAEARHLGIPVVALANSDCDLSEVDYPIPANDSGVKSVAFFVKEIADTYKNAAKKPKTETEKKG